MGWCNPLTSEVDFCGQVNQYVRYVDSCPQFVILIPTTLVGSQWFLNHLVWQKIQEPLTQDAKFLRVVGVILVRKNGSHQV